MEAERSSIAAEIHDGLLPYLFAAAAKLAAIRRADGAAESPIADALADVARWVDESRQVARKLMDGISYPPAALKDPIHAAADFLDDVLDLSSMPNPPVIRWPGHSAALAELPAETAIAIYRLTIESVRNAVRHAGANEIEVSVEQDRERTIIRIQDDGCGFDADSVATEHLHGIALARRRALAGGIEMEVQSSQTPGSNRTAGTCIMLTVARNENSR